MSDNLTTVQTNPLTWTTKNGTVKQAHTPSAQARGNKAARLACEDTKTLQQLNNNTFGPFLRDVLASLTGAHIAHLQHHVNTSTARIIDGHVYMVSGGVDL